MEIEINGALSCYGKKEREKVDAFSIVVRQFLLMVRSLSDFNAKEEK